MLKVYRFVPYYKVDNKEWARCGRVGYKICEETSEEELCLQAMSWDEVYANAWPSGICIGETFFRHRPYIEVSCSYPDDCLRFYKGDFQKFTYIKRYEEWSSCPLEWIMKHAPADLTIQYMKERGMAVCPVQ